MNNDTNKEQLGGLISKYLSEAKLMQIVSCVDNHPWLAHVWFAPDDAFNLYFISRKDRRHSIEIRKHGRVAGGIVQPPFEGLGQKVRGIGLEGTGKELAGSEISAGYGHYEARWPQVKQHAPLESIITDRTPVRVYRVTPSTIVLFDEVNFPDNPRQEFRL